MAGAFTEIYKPFMNGATEDVWIETGTYNGNSIQRSLNFGFREIHTIEVVKTTYDNLCVIAPHLCSDPRVHRYLGSSRYLLSAIIGQVINRHVVFWLDAHYAGGPQYEQDEISECPLIDELTVIVNAPWEHPPLVCIDDTNMFQDALWLSDHDRGRFTREEWPGEQQIMDVMTGWNHYGDDNILVFYK